MIQRERFEREAEALWSQLQRLAQRRPRLERLYARDADPRVARLVQSAAFALATAQNRLEDDGQALVRPLVARALPESLRPRPSSTILALSGASGRAGNVRGASFAARVGPVRIPFEVVWPVALAPVGIEAVAVDRLDAHRQVLRLAVVRGSGGSAASFDTIRVFVHLPSCRTAFDFIHALRSGEASRAKCLDSDGAVLADRELPAGAVSWVRVDTQEPALVSARADRFVSSTLLRDLFSFPESFCFFDLHVGAVHPKTDRVELVLPLGHVVDEVAGLMTEHLRLFCTPATNQFVAPIEPLANVAQEARLQVAGKPHAEILEVRALAAQSVRQAGVRTPLRSWEAPATPHAFEPEDTYFALEQRLAAAEERTELRATFGRLESFPSAPGGAVQGEVLASDGALTSTLGPGEIGSLREGAVNITRVTPSRRAPLGDNHAWRVSAYARMPAGRLAERDALTEFLRLHDPARVQDAAPRVRPPTLRSTGHAQEHDLDDGVLTWGDVFDLDVEPDGASRGELWILGALVQRALAERNEVLRFTRLVVRRDGAPFAEYAALAGGRLPFPLG